MKIVRWTEIVGKDFIDVFKKIVMAEIYMGNISIDDIIKKFGNDEWNKYKIKRDIMRECGWYISFYKKSGELDFGSIYPPEEREYISMNEYIEGKRAERIVREIDKAVNEYENTFVRE
jgi:hypothetical protein